MTTLSSPPNRFLYCPPCAPGQVGNAAPRLILTRWNANVHDSKNHYDRVLTTARMRHGAYLVMFGLRSRRDLLGVVHVNEVPN